MVYDPRGAVPASRRAAGACGRLKHPSFTALVSRGVALSFPCVVDPKYTWCGPYPQDGVKLAETMPKAHFG